MTLPSASHLSNAQRTAAPIGVGLGIGDLRDSTRASPSDLLCRATLIWARVLAGLAQ